VHFEYGFSTFQPTIDGGIGEDTIKIDIEDFSTVNSIITIKDEDRIFSISSERVDCAVLAKYILKMNMSHYNTINS